MNTERFLKTKKLFEGFSLLILLAILFLILIVSIGTQAKIILVILGFSPAIITVILGIILYEESRTHKLVTWFAPLLLLAIFFYIATNVDLLASNLDVGALVAINLIISIIYITLGTIILEFLSRNPKQTKPKMNLKDYVASIEDKSKALNFVIGRVYSKYHGGSKEQRAKILIPSEWYTEFTELKPEDKEDKETMKKILERIRQRLITLQKTETEVFGNDAKKLKNIQRNAFGNDKIINVLITNDKDPVDQYYKGALQFCDELRQVLK